MQEAGQADATSLEEEREAQEEVERLDSGMYDLEWLHTA